MIARSQLTSFAKRHFETILLWCLSILSGFWAVTFKRVLEARYLRALRGERPLKPPPASAAVTPRTGGSPAPAPFSLRRRGGRLPGTPRAGNLPPAARCVPATAGARGATGQPEPPLQPSPAQPSPAEAEPRAFEVRRISIQEEPAGPKPAAPAGEGTAGPRRGGRVLPTKGGEKRWGPGLDPSQAAINSSLLLWGCPGLLRIYPSFPEE